MNLKNTIFYFKALQSINNFSSIFPWKKTISVKFSIFFFPENNFIAGKFLFGLLRNTSLLESCILSSEEIKHFGGVFFVGLCMFYTTCQLVVSKKQVDRRTDNF